jgi:hypothetical protein
LGWKAAERQYLERIARATSGQGDQVQRARALLAVSAGQSWTATARTNGFKSRAGIALLPSPPIIVLCSPRTSALATIYMHSACQGRHITRCSAWV